MARKNNQKTANQTANKTANKTTAANQVPTQSAIVQIPDNFNCLGFKANSALKTKFIDVSFFAPDSDKLSTVPVSFENTKFENLTLTTVMVKHINLSIDKKGVRKQAPPLITFEVNLKASLFKVTNHNFFEKSFNLSEYMLNSSLFAHVSGSLDQWKSLFSQYSVGSLMPMIVMPFLSNGNIRPEDAKEVKALTMQSSTYDIAFSVEQLTFLSSLLPIINQDEMAGRIWHAIISQLVAKMPK